MVLWMEKLQHIDNGRILKMNGDFLYVLSSYRENPILKPEDLGLVWYREDMMMKGAVFNGGAEIYNNYIIMTPRCHKNYVRKSYLDEELGIKRFYMENYITKTCVLYSENGVKFKNYDHVIIENRDPEDRDFRFGIEDVRITRFKDGEYILIGCGKKTPPFKGSGGDRIAIYTTKNFREIMYRGIVDEFDSRNALIFPEYIDGKLYMIFRLHPNIHIDILKEGLEQLHNPRKYSELWRSIYRNKVNNILLKMGKYPHENEKIGGGPPPIKTGEGWLLIYHSVGYITRSIAELYGLNEAIVRGYSISAAILDENEPKKVLYRTKFPIYIPHNPWEYEGNREYPVDIPYVVFPTGILKTNNKLTIYAGAGDKYMILLSSDLDDLINYIINHGEKYKVK